MNIDLFNLQQTFDAQRIMLCFNGQLSASLIEEIGKALRNYLSSQAESASASIDVFGAYIELTQNIRHYSESKNWPNAIATVVIARDAEDRYLICAGNEVLPDDGIKLVSQIDKLSVMDKTQLRQLYKAQLRAPRPEGIASGAGLGLIDIARKASTPITASLQSISSERSFFSFKIVI